MWEALSLSSRVLFSTTGTLRVLEKRFCALRGTPPTFPVSPQLLPVRARRINTQQEPFLEKRKKKNNCHKNLTEAHSQTVQCQLHSRKADPKGQLQQSCLISHTQEARGCTSAKSCTATNSWQLNGPLLLAGQLILI